MNLFTYASSLLDSLNDASNNTVKHLNQNRISCSTLFMQPGVEKQGKSTKSVKNVFPRVENFRHFLLFLVSPLAPDSELSTGSRTWSLNIRYLDG